MVNVIDLDVTAVRAGLDEDRILLVDVREPHEFAHASIPGSVNLPLSRFDPAALPEASGRDLVFLCAAGIRSVSAVERCHLAHLPGNAQLAGGIKAWITPLVSLSRDNSIDLIRSDRVKVVQGADLCSTILAHQGMLTEENRGKVLEILEELRAGQWDQTMTAQQQVAA